MEVRRDNDQGKTKLERIGELAQTQKETVFNNLAHVLDLDLLRESYRQLEGKKAVGIDGVTKAKYGEKLEENLQVLLASLRKESYKPQATRRINIPKEDGSERTLRISCFEDKIVQGAVATILTTIYEPIFLGSSYGYREGIEAHAALRDLMKYSNALGSGATIETDLEKYFDSIPHELLLEMLKKKITDKRFLRIIVRLIRTPEMVEGKAVLNERGCPQGSIVGPILANIYLHYVMDEWFEEVKTNHLRGKANQVRFADDMVFVFQYEEDAQRFYKVLPKRLEKYGLRLNEEKSRLLKSGRRVAKAAAEEGRKAETYKFLGFVCYWGLSRKGHWRLKYKSRGDRYSSKLQELKKYLKRKLTERTDTTIQGVIRALRGWINYHAISDNERSVSAFIHAIKHILFRWINRKGGKRKIAWESFGKKLKMIGYPESFKTKSMFTAYRMR